VKRFVVLEATSDLCLEAQTSAAQEPGIDEQEPEPVAQGRDPPFHRGGVSTVEEIPPPDLGQPADLLFGTVSHPEFEPPGRFFFDLDP